MPIIVVFVLCILSFSVQHTARPGNPPNACTVMGRCFLLQYPFPTSLHELLSVNICWYRIRNFISIACTSLFLSNIVICPPKKKKENKIPPAHPTPCKQHKTIPRETWWHRTMLSIYSCSGHSNRNKSRSCATAGLCLAQSSRNCIISSFQRSQPTGNVSRTRELGECAIQ